MSTFRFSSDAQIESVGMQVLACTLPKAVAPDLLPLPFSG
jgi:hypothetical protein